MFLNKILLYFYTRYLRKITSDEILKFFDIYAEEIIEYQLILNLAQKFLEYIEFYQIILSNSYNVINGIFKDSSTR